MNVVVRGMVLGGQGHKNVGIRCPNRSRVAVREIDAAVGQTYVVNNALDFARWNLLPNRLLHLIAKVGGFFNAHSRWSTQVKFESAAVNAGKKVPAQPRDQNCQRAETAREERNQENPPVLETESPAARDSSHGISRRLPQNLFETVPADCGWRRNHFAVFSPRNKILRHGRDDRPGEQIRRQHRENHCFGERHKEIPRHARQQEHRSKHNTDRKRGHERGCRDLRRAVEDNFVHVLLRFRFTISIDVLDLDRGIVHQDADRQSESAERHDVDRFSDGAEAR